MAARTTSVTSGSGQPAPSRIRGAIFDFGGVMTEPVFRRPDNVHADMLGLAAFFLSELRAVYPLPTGAHDLHLLETGRLAEAEFFARLCDRYAAQGGPQLDPVAARQAVFSRGITACGAMVDAVRTLRTAGYRTALLTNNAREWEPEWRPVIPVEDLFDVVVDSSVVGLRKPDPAIYLLTCARLGLRPEECIFVDDLDCNVDAARSLGMEAVLCGDPVTVAGQVLGRLADTP